MTVNSPFCLPCVQVPWNSLVVGADVLELAVDRDLHRFAGGVLAFRLHLHGPRRTGRSSRRSRDFTVAASAPGLIAPVIVLAVPVEIEQQAVRVVLRPPLAAPLPFQRMAELRCGTPAWQGQRETSTRSNEQLYRIASPYRVPLAGLLLAGLRTRTEDRLAEIVFQAIQVLVVLLADVLGQLAAFAPRDVPRHRERPRVRARIVDRRLVVQRLLVGTRPPLDTSILSVCGWPK